MLVKLTVINMASIVFCSFLLSKVTNTKLQKHTKNRKYLSAIADHNKISL